MARCHELIRIFGKRRHCPEPPVFGKSRCFYHAETRSVDSASDKRWERLIDHNYHVDNQGSVIRDVEAVNLDSIETARPRHMDPVEDDYSEESFP